MFRYSILAILALLVGSSVGAAASLELWCETGADSRQPLAAIERGRLLLDQGAGRIPAPRDARWSIQGDLFAHSDLVRWLPAFTLRHAEEAELRSNSDGQLQVDVAVQNLPGEVPPALTTIRQDWPSLIPAESAAIVAWYADNRIWDVAVEPIPEQATNLPFVRNVRFELPLAAARGQPLLLLWQHGAFVAPTPLFESPAMQRALTAIVRDDAPALETAIANGADPTLASREKLGLGWYAAAAGSPRTLAVLLKHHPALVNERPPGREGSNPLLVASRLGRIEVVAMLAAHTSQDQPASELLGTALRDGARHGHVGLLQHLVQRLSPAGLRLAAGAAFDEAIRNGQLEAARAMHAAGGDSSRSLRQELMVYHFQRGNMALGTLLLEQGANPNTAVDEITPLVAAARFGTADLAAQLISAGAKPDQRSPMGLTPLLAAATAGNTEYARVLLENRARPRTETRSGVTPLHLAAEVDAADLIRLLLDAGADLEARTKARLSPLDNALLAGARNAALVLAAAGGRVSLRDPGADKLLECAVRLDLGEILEPALQAGWPADTRFETWPALRIAQLFGSTRCAELLVAAGATSRDDDPVPIVQAPELDARLRFIAAPLPRDPRGPDEYFPEQTVRFDVLVDSSGKLLFPRAADSHDPLLTSSVLETLPSWRSTPPTHEGRPAAVRSFVSVPFRSSADRSLDPNALGEPPRPLVTVRPVYPPAAMLSDLSGMVIVGFVVLENGTVSDPYVVESTNRVFEDFAIEAILQWQFEPGKRRGKPTKTRMKIPIIFNLRSE